eukprot:gene34436-41678_t
MEPEQEEESGRLDTNVLVAVRCRPLSSKEKGNNETSCVRFLSDQITLVNPAGNGDDHSFGFDLIFDEFSKQEDVWKAVGQPILAKALQGFNGTIFAYGQTGSGKTWSMQGGDGDMQGIIPRMNDAIFERISEEKKSRPTVKFLVTVSYFEIYNEVIFDLLDPTDRKKRLNKGGLEIKEHPALGVYVKGLQEIVTEDAHQLQLVIDQGMKHRTVASTQMNADSSRSHSVFVVSIHQKDESSMGNNIFAKINLVDLAGSERVKSTGATGATLKEGANINKSLSALGNVINALVECSKGKNTFIPYRNSKLTRVLQESLGGNAVTSMLAAMSPAASNFDETLSTLKYANRAKAIKVKAVKNEEAQQVSKLHDEIRMLREKLQQQQQGGAGADGEVDEKTRSKLRDLEEAMKNTWEQKAQLSLQYEQERTALLQEQQSAVQALQAAKEQAWQLLIGKDQMDATLSFVLDTLKNNQEAFFSFNQSDAEGDLNVSLLQTNLQKASQLLGKLTASEQKVKDTYLLVQMFRASFLADIESLSQCLSKDTLDIMSVQQICESLLNKFKSLSDAFQRYLSAQEDTHRIFEQIQHVFSFWQDKYHRFTGRQA